MSCRRISCVVFQLRAGSAVAAEGLGRRPAGWAAWSRVHGLGPRTFMPSWKSTDLAAQPNDSRLICGPFQVTDPALLFWRWLEYA